MAPPLQPTPVDANPTADLPHLSTTTMDDLIPIRPDTPPTIDSDGLISSAPDTPPLSKTAHKQTHWPDPLIIAPTAPHTHTLILLHGRGGNAKEFGPFLLFATPTSSELCLPALFPGVKWVFPTAKKRRAALFKRMPISQWFDNWSLEYPEDRQELQYEGIAETSAFVAGLIAEEVKELRGRAGRVVLGGLSQGCAVGLHVYLNWKGEGELAGQALGGFVGMSGWLPFATALDPKSEEEVGDDDPFCTSDGEGEEKKVKKTADDGRTQLEKIQLRAANTARDIASMPPLSGEGDDVPAFPRTPVFLGHGRNDPKVLVELAERARDVLESLGCKVQWRDYDSGHWYKVPDEIDDIVNFLTEDVGIGRDED
ncbi:hypothetical protein BFW01_g5163 [Lasiodiplodia theobromae]|uniref:Phospholipase/carboxylesterase n=1 Tax=Lasiodiplodia theobromae TaxID=45133 RepID=UPI0015C2F9C2|nr:Phospholipase/carboxylesterase [Lasiodiplodia theobromae]KAF4536200.1 Phospholipase/carboxylesterase [Lasiodiplodia theobromae]KAF9634268.1 hypothetical protein BFW01_g5163 [Lasiodiplodia theobromae]